MHRRPALWTALGSGIVLSSQVERSVMVMALVGAASAGCALVWALIHRGAAMISVCVLVAMCCVGGLRHQAATQLFTPNHISRIVLDHRAGIVWGTIDEEPMRGNDGKTRFVLCTEAVRSEDAGDTDPEQIEGLILVTVVRFI